MMLIVALLVVFTVIACDALRLTKEYKMRKMSIIGLSARSGRYDDYDDDKTIVESKSRPSAVKTFFDYLNSENAIPTFMIHAILIPSIILGLLIFEPVNFMVPIRSDEFAAIDQTLQKKRILDGGNLPTEKVSAPLAIDKEKFRELYKKLDQKRMLDSTPSTEKAMSLTTVIPKNSNSDTILPAEKAPMDSAIPAEQASTGVEADKEFDKLYEKYQKLQLKGGLAGPEKDFEEMYYYYWKQPRP